MMDGFEREVSNRLPLAKAALEAFAFDHGHLTHLHDRAIERGYTDELTFPNLWRTWCDPVC